MPKRTQSMNALYYKYLRRNVDLNLRSSAFICGFVLPGLLFLQKTRRASNDLIPVTLAMDFMKAAMQILSVLLILSK